LEPGEVERGGKRRLRKTRSKGISYKMFNWQTKKGGKPENRRQWEVRRPGGGKIKTFKKTLDEKKT